MKANSKIALIGAAGVAFLLAQMAKRKANGIGAVKRAPRRIWNEVEAAQRAGIDLTDPNGWENRKGALDKIMFINEAIPRSSKSEKPTHQIYFNQLRRAYRSIAGTNLPYDESIVRNDNDDVILIYRDYHMEELPYTAADWVKAQNEVLYGGSENAYWYTIADIATGAKFVWASKGEHRGVQQLIFGTIVPEERKQRISYLASPEKGGKYPEAYAHYLWESVYQMSSDSQEITDGVLEALRTCTSVGQAQQICIDAYLKAHQVQEPLLYQDVPF